VGALVLNYCEYDYFVGDLICLKSYAVGDGGWFGLVPDVGIVLEVIEIEETFILHDSKFRCFDLVVCWISTGTTETVPDIMIENYDRYMERLSEKGLR